MAYQNNNNRITPNAAGKNQITPVTQIVNKELKYQIDTGKVERTQNLAQSLAALGKGIVDFEQSGILQKKAQEQAIEIYAQKEQGENAKAWKEAQKKVEGLNAFNPYNKPTYENYVVKDFYNKAKTELLSDHDYYKRKPEEIEKFLTEKQKNLKDLIQSNNIPTSVSGKYMEEFINDCSTFYSNYVVKNAEFNRDNLHKVITNQISKDIRIQWLNNPKELQGEGFSSLLEQYQKENPSMPESDLINLFTKSIKTAIISHEGTLEETLIKDSVKNLTLNGVKLIDVVPDIELTLTDIFKSTRQEKFNKMLQEEQLYKLQTQRNMRAAEEEYFKTLLANPDIDIVELSEQLAEKYDIVGEYDSLLTTIVNNKNTLNNIDNKIISDVEALKYLDTKLGLDELDLNELTQAYTSGQINRSDYYSILDRYTKKEKAEQTVEDKQAKSAYKSRLSEAKVWLTNSDLKKKLQNTSTKDKKSTAYADYAQDIAYVNTLVESGEVTPNEGITMLDELSKDYNDRYFTKQEIDPKQLLLKSYRSSLNKLEEAQYNQKRAEKCFNALGVISSPTGTKITSGIKDNRTVTVTNEKGETYTKTSAHQAYDLKAVKGTPVRIPRGCQDGGTVISTGKNETMGCFALVKLNESGHYMLLQHLNNVVPHFAQGHNIPSGYVFAYTGNTGATTGEHLDISFYSRNADRRITVEEALKGIDRKKADAINKGFKNK